MFPLIMQTTNLSHRVTGAKPRFSEWGGVTGKAAVWGPKGRKWGWFFREGAASPSPPTRGLGSAV